MNACPTCGAVPVETDAVWVITGGLTGRRRFACGFDVEKGVAVPTVLHAPCPAEED